MCRSDGSMLPVFVSSPPVESSPVAEIPSVGGPTTGFARANRSGNCVANLYVP